MEGKSSVMDASTFIEGSLRARNKQFCSWADFWSHPIIRKICAKIGQYSKLTSVLSVKICFLIFIFEKTLQMNIIFDKNLHNKFQLKIHVRDCFQDLFLKCVFPRFRKCFYRHVFFCMDPKGVELVAIFLD
jgi:hypothetical protein